MSNLLQRFVETFNRRDAEGVAALFVDVTNAIGHGPEGKDGIGSATGGLLRLIGPGRLALGQLDGEEVVIGLFPHEEGGWGRQGLGRILEERDGKIVRIQWQSDQTLAWQAQLMSRF